jgi:hypothetical protein
MNAKRTGIRAIICMVFVLCARTSGAYSILAHEALIDSCWTSYIQPLLLSKYPGSTKAQLKTAHAYAYGGAIAPDIGYFPFGKPFFTDLVHYVRSGDFVNALIDDARDINEYAFALGFLCHYMADKYGHSLATNESVPMLYPKERKKYGDYVTYENDHLSHKRTEFGFDVLQVVEGDYAKLAYHDFIGFEVSGPLLERAFAEIYGMDIHDVFPDFSLSIGSLRWSFKRLFPALTKAAWLIKNKQLKKDHPELTRRSYIYSMKRADYYKEFGRAGRKPGVFSALIALIIEVVPKVGPLRPLKFKAPGPEVAKLYHSSFDTALVNYRAALRAFRAGTRRLPNIDFDTGNFTTPGEYGLADKNYDLLVAGLYKNKFKLLNRDLRVNIIDYYSHRPAPNGTREVQHAWTKTEEALRQLRQAKDAGTE